MKQTWNDDLPKGSIKPREYLRLVWKPLYTRFVGAAVSLIVLLLLEFFLLKLMVAWF